MRALASVVQSHSVTSCTAHIVHTLHTTVTSSNWVRTGRDRNDVDGPNVGDDGDGVLSVIITPTLCLRVCVWMDFKFFGYDIVVTHTPVDVGAMWANVSLLAGPIDKWARAQKVSM